MFMVKRADEIVKGDVVLLPAALVYVRIVSFEVVNTHSVRVEYVNLNTGANQRRRTLPCDALVTPYPFQV